MADQQHLPAGLSSAEVADRRARGQANLGADRTSRSIGDILRANILTRFNGILGSLLVVILVVGAPQDALFGIVLVVNALIGIAQELRAKITLDRLAVLSAPRVRVIRDGAPDDIAVAELVAGDLVLLRPGDQLVADGVVTASASLQADESLLTGESVPVAKQLGDQLLSGSFVVAGSGDYEAVGVGAEAYARKLAAEARQFALVRSDLVDGINRILRYVTWALGPVAVLLLVSQLHGRATVSDSLVGTVAALVGMVPQGLVLLTSVAFGVSAVALARRKVLVQQLPAVEGLARVDTVCLDKTGTLTDGSIQFDRLIPLDGDQYRAEAALGALADDENRNATLAAIGAALLPPADRWTRHEAVPFSSARKWSAASFTGHGSWILGAPEIVLPPADREHLARAATLAATGHRVLALARADEPLAGESLPSAMHAAALVLMAERLRPDARDTISYFTAQGVKVKVISGDSPATAGAVAARAGVPVADDPVDARSMPEDLDSLAALLEQRSVFGRVTPHQKQAMVMALQARGHAVAMTGDGVNDVLALKLADIGIAMGSGAPATRAVAELVLLDSQFSTLPGVVGEGRRVTANIERVANLFVTKTVWATLLAIATSAALLPYPFLPRHLTIIDTLAIGVPSFFLALAPNKRRYRPGFTDRVLRFAVPAGTIIAAATIAAYAAAHAQGLALIQQRTAATIVTVALSLCVLTLLATPLTWRRILLIVAMVAGFALLFPLQLVRTFYELKLPHGMLAITLLIAAVAGAAALVGFWLAFRRRPAYGGELPGAWPVGCRRYVRNRGKSQVSTAWRWSAGTAGRNWACLTGSGCRVPFHRAPYPSYSGRKANGPLCG
ncbi:MAG TPA: HAD-IC family P-type ATPase [Streptosporangiaceae bacterium]|nr:HAD-IC family P-type ATPase [Streptosporangiaceae bacterium]